MIMPTKKYRPCALVAGDSPVSSIDWRITVTIMLVLGFEAYVLSIGYAPAVAVMLTCTGVSVAGAAIDPFELLGHLARRFSPVVSPAGNS
jgi:hypothetical protein